MQDAKLYRKNNILQQTNATRCLEKYGSKINWKKNNNKIIDVGCGEGTVTRILKKFCPQNTTIFACDINKEMLRMANEHHSDEYITFGELDIAGDIPEELVGRYTHIFSFCALNWVPDQITTFNNIYNLLEDNGECFLVIVGYSPLFDAQRVLAQSDKWKTWVYNVDKYISPYHDSLDPIQDITNMMEKNGFINIDIVQDKRHYYFDNLESLRSTLQAINPFIIPAELSDDFWNDYLELWKKFDGLFNNTDGQLLTDGKCDFNYMLITVHARK